MLERHYFFAIAKVAGRYRIVGAVANRWILGRTVVRQCLHTFKILGADSNAAGLRRELFRAEEVR